MKTSVAQTIVFIRFSCFGASETLLFLRKYKDFHVSGSKKQDFCCQKHCFYRVSAFSDIFEKHWNLIKTMLLATKILISDPETWKSLYFLRKSKVSEAPKTRKPYKNNCLGNRNLDFSIFAFFDFSGASSGGVGVAKPDQQGHWPWWH